METPNPRYVERGIMWNRVAESVTARPGVRQRFTYVLRWRDASPPTQVMEVGNARSVLERAVRRALGGGPARGRGHSADREAARARRTWRNLPWPCAQRATRRECTASPPYLCGLATGSDGLPGARLRVQAFSRVPTRVCAWYSRARRQPGSTTDAAG